jgi:ankyrin repeat protein
MLHRVKIKSSEVATLEEPKPEFKDNRNRTPLLYEAERECGAVVKLLLEKGSEPDFKDSRNKTPLSHTT